MSAEASWVYVLRGTERQLRELGLRTSSLPHLVTDGCGRTRNGVEVSREPSAGRTTERLAGTYDLASVAVAALGEESRARLKAALMSPAQVDW